MRVDPNAYKDMGAIQLRKEVRSLIKSANAILVENEYTNIQNARYFLRDLHITSRGGVTTNKGTERLSKAESMTAIKQLANFINADQTSQSYKEYEKSQRTKSMQKARDTYNERHRHELGNMTDEDWNEMFSIKEEFPELFEADALFYLEVMKTSKAVRRKGGDTRPSLMQSFIDAKRELQASGNAWTPADLKALAIQKAQEKGIR